VLHRDAFRKFPRAWCEHCGQRFIQYRYGGMAELCGPCCRKVLEQDERDAEARSWRGFSDEERARYG
jgi:hypothetical protein